MLPETQGSWSQIDGEAAVPWKPPTVQLIDLLSLSYSSTRKTYENQWPDRNAFLKAQIWG